MVERAQPWLGTLVAVRVSGLSPLCANQAINSAFEQVATVHRLMSFHDRSSDVSRLNRAAVGEPVPVSSQTLEVLNRALGISAATDGCFDISVAHELVDVGLLPRPAETKPEPVGCWRDIELRSDGKVLFHRPLWIDLGGIAKGYAVDRAIEALQQWNVRHVVVNAGGDLRVHGSGTEVVGLELETLVDAVPVVEVSNASVASSSGHRRRFHHRGQTYGPHFHGSLRAPTQTDRFVCVVAEECVVADALTKVVMAKGPESQNVLQAWNASAYFHDPSKGWQLLERGARN